MNDLFRLDGKKAIIIGGAGGIGQGIAQAFAFYGADVSIASRKMDSLIRAKEEIKEAIGADISVYTVDAAKEESIIALFDTVIADKGKIDILVNSQGFNKKFSAVEFPVDVMTEMFEVNAIGVAMCCKHFGKHMKENGYGRIINISSVRGLRAINGGNLGYSATKGALDMITRTLATELGPEVTVNALAPANTYTPMMKELFEKNPWLWNSADDKPLKRIGKIEDCMGPAVFLASEAGAFLTGQIIYADGGLTAIG